MKKRTDCFFPHPDGKHEFSTNSKYAVLKFYKSDGDEIRSLERTFCVNDADALLIYAAFADKILHLFDGQFDISKTGKSV